ncbi:MAG: amidohydrolase [Oceanospirillaceae bacterium]|nr:amidohydrolase [Oceanospirillaceae bacterium]
MSHIPKRLRISLLATVLSVQAIAPSISQAAESAADSAEVRKLIEAVTPEVVEWRRDIHQHPELGNRETRTAELVTEHLKALGIEVRTGIAHTGVVGILRGAEDGPVVALRADMDALPVTEAVDLPFASKVATTYNGNEVGVAHACGHDAHTAILMGAAEVLAQMKDEIKGTVMFIFQPAEEGAPDGEEGGAKMMLKEGLFAALKPDAVFGLHVMPKQVGTIEVRERGVMASSDTFKIKVTGKQTHGGMPWNGVDPIVLSSQIVLGLQTITSRRVDLTKSPAVISVGAINGGVRQNIVPSEVEMIGTIRVLDPDIREQVHQLMERTVKSIAESGGGSAELTITAGYAVTYNDPELTRRMMPSLEKVADVKEALPITPAEDFSFYAQEVPGMYFFLGAAPDNPEDIYPNHSPKFQVNEKALPIGVTAMTTVALDFLNGR